MTGFSPRFPTRPQTSQEATHSVRHRGRGRQLPGLVQKLVVERCPGRKQLIVPDFFAFGLVALPVEATEDNFVAAMHKATRLPSQNHPGCWQLYIEPMEATFWHSFSMVWPMWLAGIARAQSLVQELVDGERLLDERTAVTACLGPAANTPENTPRLFPEP